ncbi:MAG: hypothetical protein AAGK26_00195 [Pseudomonadota bacterium]
MNAQVANQMDPTQAPAIDGEIEAIGTDVREFITGMDAKAEAMEDEDKRSKTEAAISRVLRDYEPLMDEDTRTFFGKWLERDDVVEVSRDDIDPTRQRRAAEQDATDPTRTQVFGPDCVPAEVQELSLSDDPRGFATKAVLTEADRKVSEHFEVMGMNGDLALSHIRNGADVDRQTRDNWFERDVRTLANTLSLSENQARTDMKAVYKTAAEIYRDACGEIREINRACSENRGDQFLADRASNELDKEIAREKRLGFDDASIGGRLGEIEDTMDRRVYGESRAEETTARTDSRNRQASGRPDLKVGVRGRIVATGSTLYDTEDKDSQSPYVDLKIEGRDTPYRVWGVDLPDMMERQNLAVGDTAPLVHDGFKYVTVEKRDKETGEEKEVEVKRCAWKASDIERASRETDRSQDHSIPPHVSSPEAERVEQVAQTGVTGVIIDAKESQVRPDDPSSMSFYVDMKVEGKDAPHRIWGTALQDQMARNNMSIGDKVTFVEAGKEEVTRSRRNTETDEIERVNVTRKAWDVKDVDRQVDRDPEVQERLRRERADRAKGDRGVSR